MIASEFTQLRSTGCIIVAENTGCWFLQQRSDTVTITGVLSIWDGGISCCIQDIR